MVPGDRRRLRGSCGTERLAQHVDRLLDGSRRSLRRSDGIQHHEVVDDGVVANARRRHAGLDEPPCIRLTLIPEYVVLVDDHQRRRQPDELLA